MAMEKDARIMEELYSWAGKLGRKSTGAEAVGEAIDKAAIMKAGRQRVLGAGVAGMAGLGLVGRSSGVRGLSPRSSAPPPQSPF